MSEADTLEAPVTNTIEMKPFTSIDIETIPNITIGDTVLRGPTLYKYDSTGKLRVWYMEQQDNRYRFITGQQPGALVTSEWTKCIGKQKRSDEEQALFEIQSNYTYNLEREYFRTPQDAEGGARFFKPMLAEKWKDCGWQGAMKRLTDAGYTASSEFDPSGFYYQHKFDGFCCIATIGGLQSREGKPIVAVPHIMEALQPYFEEFPDGVLHGELYSHDLKDNFQKLVSLLKKQKDIKPEQFAEAARIVQYHVYDYPAPHARDLSFSGRYDQLQIDLANVAEEDGVIQIAQTWAVQDLPHLNQLMGQSLELGYEGGIGRLDLGPYVQKRSWQVLKIKEFDDAEFEVAAIEEGKGNYTGYAKRAKLWIPGADRTGGPTAKNTFGAGIKGGLSKFNKDLLANPESQKVATVRYFGVSNDGIPRFPVVTVWHGLERTL